MDYRSKEHNVSPTARTLQHLKKLGYEAGVVERHNTFSHKKHDLLGCIDVVAVHPGMVGVLGVQATSGTNVAARLTKSMDEPRLRTWLKAGGCFVVHGWRKLQEKTKKGTTVSRWRLRSIEVVLDGDTLRSVEA